MVVVVTRRLKEVNAKCEELCDACCPVEVVVSNIKPPMQTDVDGMKSKRALGAFNVFFQSHHSHKRRLFSFSANDVMCGFQNLHTIGICG